jgi:hypothetical protein
LYTALVNRIGPRGAVVQKNKRKKGLQGPLQIKFMLGIEMTSIL